MSNRPKSETAIPSDIELATALLCRIAGGSWSETSIPPVLDLIAEVRCHALDNREPRTETATRTPLDIALKALREIALNGEEAEAQEAATALAEIENRGRPTATARRKNLKADHVREGDLALVQETASCGHHDECNATYGTCTCAVGVAEAALRLLDLRIEDEWPVRESDSKTHRGDGSVGEP